MAGYSSPTHFVAPTSVFPNYELFGSATAGDSTTTADTFNLYFYDSPQLLSSFDDTAQPNAQSGDGNFNDGHSSGNGSGRWIRKRPLSNQFRQSRDAEATPGSGGYLSTVQELLGADAAVDRETIFSSVGEANNAGGVTENSTDDPTVPATLEQKKALVKALFHGIRRVDLAQDNPNMIRPFEEGRYPDERIEMACWNILVRRSFLLLPVLIIDVR